MNFSPRIAPYGPWMACARPERAVLRISPAENESTREHA